MLMSRSFLPFRPRQHSDSPSTPLSPGRSGSSSSSSSNNLNLAASSGSLPSDYEEDDAFATAAATGPSAVDDGMEDLDYLVRVVLSNIKGKVRDVEIRADCYDAAKNQTIAVKVTRQVVSCRVVSSLVVSCRIVSSRDSFSFGET